MLTDNAKTKFNGLYDENGFPVTAELEKNEDGVVLTLIRKLTDEDKQSVCDEYDDCSDCPLLDICYEDYDSEVMQ